MEDQSSPVLSARSVTKTYRSQAGEVHALRSIDLDIGAGELVTVLGPSGNGKTTLLNCLSGIDSIDDGTVLIDGKDIHRLPDRERTKHRAARMGFIFQSFNLIPVLSARENVEVPLAVLGVDRRESSRRATELLERVGLGERCLNRPQELSGGEQQRVAIARALVTNPAIVWADEPTGNLDSETAVDVLTLLRDVRDAGQTVVMVTHDPTIGRSGDRSVHVRNGQIEYDGPPRAMTQPGLPAQPDALADEQLAGRPEARM